jgi:N-acetylglucosaminyldiphosphoundecaprenol N-acetyl-beta-D-mannosaminyltransferase
MQHKTITILGVNIDQVDTTDAVEAILHLIEKHDKKHAPKDLQSTKSLSSYICTINADFLTKVYGWNQVRHFELLNIVRRSKLVINDGTPLIWLSKLLGNPLNEKIVGSELISLLSEALGERKKTVFILGGEEEALTKAKEDLEKAIPGLDVVGTFSSIVITEGKAIGEAEQRDALILEEIHKTSPDVLLINLGHPKQEIWFDRVQLKLRVPVVIGIGDALSFRNVKQIPKWIQKCGLEWAYRLSGEPKKYLKRYFYDTIFYMYTALPLIIMHRLNQFIFSQTMSKTTIVPDKNLLFLSQSKTVAVVKIPKFLDATNVKLIGKYIGEAYLQDAILIDFQKTRHIDLEGLSLLVHLWIRSRKENKLLVGFMMKSNLSSLMRLHRVWDLLSNDMCSNATEVARRLFYDRMASQLYESFQQDEDALTISFIGDLENSQDFDAYIQKLEPILQNKNCVIDFTYCNLIENMGFYFLLKLKQFVEIAGNTFQIKGVSKHISYQFRNAGLADAFEVLRED